MKIQNRFQKNRPLNELCTLGVGGPARLFVEVETIEDLQEVIRYCCAEKLRYLILGKGSNILFDDRGFNGLVILNKILYCVQSEGKVEVSAGYSFSLLGTQTSRKGWMGLEFASGIPGTVGGAVYMNAGAGGPETKDVLESVTYITERGELALVPKAEIEFSYRFSSFQKMKGAIAAATFILQPSAEAKARQLSLIKYRTQTQPYGDKSAGCFFRNPPHASAGALIEKCGLKGLCVGDAAVSTLHGNFLINKEEASSKDMLALVDIVRHTVKEKTGIELELEVRRIPYEEVDDK